MLVRSRVIFLADDGSDGDCLFGIADSVASLPARGAFPRARIRPPEWWVISLSGIFLRAF
jgi:hypothetical protein